MKTLKFLMLASVLSLSTTICTAAPVHEPAAADICKIEKSNLVPVVIFTLQTADELIVPAAVTLEGPGKNKLHYDAALPELYASVQSLSMAVPWYRLPDFNCKRDIRKELAIKLGENTHCRR